MRPLHKKEVVPISIEEQLEQKEEVNQELQEELQEEVTVNPGEWYVVHTYSGYENKIKVDLTKRVESMNMQDKIFQVLVPEEQEIEFKGGKKKVTNKRVFPGYVLVNMIMDEGSWYVVRHTPGVTGFVASGSKPIPLPEHEINKILNRMGLIGKKPTIIDVEVGENIKVKTGPFANFEGIVKELLADRGKVRVTISMFGRETPVELEYTQIEKA